jgi:hypothetical protein
MSKCIPLQRALACNFAVYYSKITIIGITKAAFRHYEINGSFITIPTGVCGRGHLLFLQNGIKFIASDILHRHTSVF